MSRTSTERRSKSSKKPKSSQAERLLLFAILALGVVGLSISYAGRGESSTDLRASATDTAASTGKARKDHLILNLNQRHADTSTPTRTTRF